MTKIYDNGTHLLGRKKDIYEMALTRANDDQAALELLYELKDYDDESILCIDYSHPLGYNITEWKSKDAINKGGKENETRNYL